MKRLGAVRGTGDDFNVYHSTKVQRFTVPGVGSVVEHSTGKQWAAGCEETRVSPSLGNSV